MRHPQNLRGRNQRFLLGPGRCAVFELQVPPFDNAVGFLFGKARLVHSLTRHKQVLAILEVPDKLTVPQACCQQHMGDSSRQRAVGAGVDGQPFMGLGSNGGQARVNGNHGAAFDDARKVVHHIGYHAVGGQRITAPGHQAIGVAQVIVTVAKETLGQTRAHFFGFSADGTVREVIGGAPDLGQRAIQQFGGGGRITAAHVHQLAGLARLAQFHHLVGDGVERLVPRDRHKFRVHTPAFERIGAFHRHLDAVGVIHLLRYQVTAWAAITVVGLGQRVATHPGGPTSLNKNLDGTPLGTALAGAGHPVAHGRTAGFGLAWNQRTVNGSGQTCTTCHQRPGRDPRSHDKNPPC